MLVEKKTLSIDELDAQTALELPDREMLALVNVVVFDVIDLRDVNVNVAANVCGVGVISENVEGTCTNNARQR
jgi:hypothetical protein